MLFVLSTIGQESEEIWKQKNINDFMKMHELHII